MEKKHIIKAARLGFAVIATIILGLLPLPDITWMKILLYLIPYFSAGYDVLYNAVRNIINGQIFDEEFLMALATVGAFIIGEYPEAVMVMTFFGVGELFEKIAVGKSRRSISELMSIVPDTANLIRDGEMYTVSPDEVEKGDIIGVRPGEKIPLDGIVISAETFVDTSALTGESVPKRVVMGEGVISGCVNMGEFILVEVVNDFYESTATKIMELVESSTLKKAKTEAFITKFARYYTPAVVMSAVIISVISAIITGQIIDSIRKGLVFLVVSCPCALVISVPLSFFGGIGGASRRGILIKGSEYIEALSKTQIAVFDKTGTLTKGSFSITELVPHGISRDEFLEFAAYAEAQSTHPVGKCFLNEYKKSPDLSLISRMKEYAGGGVGASYKGKEILLGNKRLMTEKGIQIPHVDSHLNTVYIALDGEYSGYALIGDSIKENAPQGVEALKALEIEKTVILTGDVRSTGEEIARKIGADEVYTDLLPDKKVEICEKLLEKKKKGKTLIFIGDGINDAPVLSRADVGIAMGAMGSDAAIEAADVVLMDDDPMKVAEAVAISKRTMMIARQNIIFALCVKGVVLVLGALGFANMWLAVFADVGVSVIAITNAMRALKQTNWNFLRSK